MSYQNFTRYYDHSSAKYFYGGIPATVIPYQSVKEQLEYADATDWSCEYIAGVKYLRVQFSTFNYQFERLYALNGEINRELFSLLEKVDAIRLCDGKVDFNRILLHNFYFNLTEDRKKGRYIIEDLEQTNCYLGGSLRMIYNIEEIFRQLSQSTESYTEYCILPGPQERKQMSLEFEYGTGSEKSYTNVLPREYFEGECLYENVVKDAGAENNAMLQVRIDSFEADDECRLYLTFAGEKKVYKARTKMNEFFFTFLKKNGLLIIRDGMVGMDLDSLHQKKFGIVWRRVYYYSLQFDSIRIF